MTELARRTGLSRETLYRTLSKKGNPRLSKLRAILKAFGGGFGGTAGAGGLKVYRIRFVGWRGCVGKRGKGSVPLPRVIFAAKFADAVFVLHCIQKKTQKTSKTDLDLAKSRYQDLIKVLNQ